ncbi:hypothetical protein KAR91_11420 [Candidatus Pacearchaeota archaeon]|nr:hypothetical protein [Candidatus Pacearchaeota archaeon]
MKIGQTVYVINRTSILNGVIGKRTSAQGFYTRWTDGYFVHFDNAFGGAFADENIFCTHEAAKKELFMRQLRYPQLRGAA